MAVSDGCFQRNLLRLSDIIRTVQHQLLVRYTDMPERLVASGFKRHFHRTVLQALRVSLSFYAE